MRVYIEVTDMLMVMSKFERTANGLAQVVSSVYI